MFDILNMRLSGWQVFRNLTLVSAMFLASGAALADRPEWAGARGGDDENGHKHGKKRGGDRDDEERKDSRHEQRQQPERYQSRRGGVEIQIGGYFDDTRRMETREYYRERSRSGHCPPGLSRKHNGCMPPGHARRWEMGESLPRDVIYHDVEPSVQIKLGTPPSGHKFIRVASDILLIAVGSGLVIDAIEDLGQ